MAYEVTANRRRPQLFKDLAGQEFVVSTLTSAIESNRIAHAYLFSGPRGVGKTSSARILAKSLNCKEGPTAEPCGVCNNCKEITNGSSIDVIEIDGASNTSVNDIREIKDEVLFAPSGSRYKIYIIDEVHMLSNSAFNALLKTIEEPPEYIIFIFATTEIHKVPATIRSRCQQFNFRLIPTETLKELIVEACNELKITYSDDAIYWIAKEGNGSSRDAYTLFDQIASFSDSDITLEKIREKLGLVGLDNMNDLVESMAQRDASAVLNKCDYILTSGVSIEQFIVDLAEYFRNLLFISYGLTKESLLGYSSERFSKVAADSFSVVQLEHGVELILKLYKDIRYSVNPRFELELLLSRLSTLTDYITNDEILDKIKIIKESISGGKFTMESTVQKKKIINKSETSDISHSNDAAAQLFNKFKKQSTSEKPVENPYKTGNVPANNNPGIDKPPVFNPEIRKNEEVNKQEPVRNNSFIENNETDFSNSSFEASVAQREPEITNEPVMKIDISSPAMDIDSIKKSLLRKIRKSHITLSSILEKADRWDRSGSKIILSYKSPFEAASVEKDKNKVLNIINEFDKTVTVVEINRDLDKKIENKNNSKSDEQIDKIVSLFRGTIV